MVLMGMTDVLAFYSLSMENIAFVFYAFMTAIFFIRVVLPASNIHIR